MREKHLRLFVTFHTTAAAMAMEKACAEDGIEGRLLPVPRVLSADCGIAWRSEPETRAAIESLLARRSIEFERLSEILI